MDYVGKLTAVQSGQAMLKSIGTLHNALGV